MGDNSTLMTSPCRVEIFSKNNVTVFQDNLESLHFARQVATIKNIQADSRPFYVMDVGRISELLDIWHQVLPRVRPFYAVNCNADDVLLKVLAGQADIGFHCQTRQNLEKALDHVAPERILYSNACWTRSAAEHAATHEVRRVSFESARDLTRLLASLKSNDETASPPLELVLNVCVNEADAGYGDDDMEANFGCAPADAPDLLQLAVDMGVPCVGVAFNLGNTGADNSSMLLRYDRAIMEMARLFEFAQCIGAPLRVLNIGGDFSASSASFAEVCAQINESLEFYFPRSEYAGLEVIATPGRFVAESAFTLMTNVIGRRSVDASYVTNDDFDVGSEAFIYETNEGYYGSFGCQINANCAPRCKPLFEEQQHASSKEYAYGNVLGPTCDESFDLLESRCRFRPLHVGEWLMWANMGAYTFNNCQDSMEMDEDEQKSSPAVFYFTSQYGWNRLNGCERDSLESMTPLCDSVPAPSFYRDYSIGSTDYSDDEGIRSASPSSLVSAEDELAAAADVNDTFFMGLDDEYFEAKQ